jgi:hypothetical protein
MKLNFKTKVSLKMARQELYIKGNVYTDAFLYHSKNKSLEDWKMT